MPKEYEKIYGYFDFQDLYTAIASAVLNGKGDSRMVEVGTWLGKSTCFMAELIKEHRARLKFYGVDTFQGEINATDQQEIVTKEGGCIYKRFLLNMKEAGVMDYVTPLKMTSKEAADLFDNDSLDFVFLDAEHLYEDVLQDLSLWYPKLRAGGVIAGHDFNGQGVNKAVTEFFKEKGIPIHQSGICFVVGKPLIKSSL